MEISIRRLWVNDMCEDNDCENLTDKQEKKPSEEEKLVIDRQRCCYIAFDEFDIWS